MATFYCLSITTDFILILDSSIWSAKTSKLYIYQEQERKGLGVNFAIFGFGFWTLVILTPLKYGPP
jgi:hypothetical protein